MTKRRFDVLIERDHERSASVTYVPVLDWLSTFGDTREEALEYTHEAILGYLEAASKEGIAAPDVSVDTETIEVEVVTPWRGLDHGSVI